MMWKLPEYYKKVMHSSNFNACCRSKSIVLSVCSMVSVEMAGKDYPVFTNSIRVEMEIYEFVVWLLKKQIMEG